MPIFVTNATNHTVHLRSFDGDSVAVHAKSRRVQVAKKFEWQIPAVQPPLRIEDGGEDVVDPCIFRPGRAIPVPVRRPRGHHNKSRQEPLMAPSQYMDKVSALNPERAAEMQKVRMAIDARFSTGNRGKKK